jgi:hypothetical protein
VGGGLVPVCVLMAILVRSEVKMEAKIIQIKPTRMTFSEHKKNIKRYVFVQYILHECVSCDFTCMNDLNVYLSKINFLLRDNENSFLKV